LQRGHGEIRGPVRIGAYSSVARSLVIPALSRVAKKNPSLQFEISSREMFDLYPMLRRGEVDYIVLNHMLDVQGIETIRLGVEENVYITPKSGAYPKVFLNHDPDDPTTERFFALQKRKPGSYQQSYFDDVYGIIDGVRNGMGKAIVSRHLVANMNGIVIQKGFVPLRDPIVLHYYSSPFTSRKHDVVVEAIKTGVPRLLAQIAS